MKMVNILKVQLVLLKAFIFAIVLNKLQNSIRIWSVILVDILVAAGLTLLKENFAEFKAKFGQLIAKQDDSLFQEVLWTDGDLPDDAFQIHTVDTLQQLTPWDAKISCANFWRSIQIINAVG